MAEGKKFKQGGSSGGAGGFKALGLTEDVFRGVVRLGFKVCAFLSLFREIFCNDALNLNDVSLSSHRHPFSEKRFPSYYQVSILSSWPGRGQARPLRF